MGDLRPISLTPLLSKVCKTFLYKWLLQGLIEIIDPRQYGFQQGCSTSHYLVKNFETMVAHLEKNKAFVELQQVDVRKAFDTSSHEEILKHMEGFHSFLIKIVESFLSERKQKTKYENELSNITTQTCGIPQGTKLFSLLCKMMATWHKDRA